VSTKFFITESTLPYDFHSQDETSHILHTCPSDSLGLEPGASIRKNIPLPQSDRQESRTITLIMAIGSILVLMLLQTQHLTTIHALSIIDRREAMLTLAAQTQTIMTVAGTMIAPPSIPLPDDDGSRMNVVTIPAAINKNGAPSPVLVSVPRVGYSLYKTEVDQAERCVQIALQAGIRHFDVATSYGSNAQVGKALQQYLSQGLSIIPSDQQDGSLSTTTTKQWSRSSTTTSNAGKLLQQRRRAELFVSHKVSNEEQSLNRRSVKTAVKKAMSQLQLKTTATRTIGNGGGNSYLDLVSIHSPLTDRSRRLATYEALLELQQEGIVRAVGVCHYGIGPLQELVDEGLPPPAVIQLVLSPFQQHKAIAGSGGWAEEHGSIVCCNAWSKLSSVDGPQEGWAVLADVAKSKGMTKAQVLVRWALQKGYLCVPRSGSKFKIERAAIVENSYGGVQPFVLTPKEMEVLDSLDEQLPAGRLGIVDGWSNVDIVDAQWDPTTAV
jgi:diketogulonate reductase-like aldo/keto reductase